MNIRSTIFASTLSLTSVVNGQTPAGNVNTNPTIPAQEIGLFGTTKLLIDVPYFCQNYFKFDGSGESWCAPTAASMLLMRDANKNHPNLKPIAENDEEAQFEMIKDIAARMGTGSKGTGIHCFLSGLQTYVKDKGYSIESLTINGTGSGKKNAAPDLKLIENMDDNTLIWLCFGYYEFNYDNHKYKEATSHLTAVVGYGMNKKGIFDPNVLIIADPNRDNKKPVYVKLEKIIQGTISNVYGKTKAEGFYDTLDIGGLNRAVVHDIIILKIK